MNAKLVSTRPLSFVTEMGEIVQMPQEAMQEVAGALGWRGVGEDEHADAERFLEALAGSEETIKLTPGAALSDLGSPIQ